MLHNGELILYKTQDGLAEIHLKAIDGTVWLTQMEIAELFQITKQNVSLHIKNLFDEQELDESSVVKDYLTTASDGKSYKTKHYNLDVILSVGYRVRSLRGTQFRQWATTTLREYLIKGFVINDARMKEPGGLDYFDELLNRIRDIRASEKRFYQKVKDVYTTATDYDKDSEAAELFFKTVQNKMLFAVTGKTAAELIKDRADAAKPNMGLTTWEGSRVRKGDVVTAKNYLGETEIEELNRVVTMYLDFAEDMAKRRKQMNMNEWAAKLDEFLKFNERQVLSGAGKVSHDHAKKIAHHEYETFDANRKDAEKIAAEEEYIEDLRHIEREAATIKRKKGQSDDAA